MCGAGELLGLHSSAELTCVNRNDRLLDRGVELCERERCKPVSCEVLYEKCPELRNPRTKAGSEESACRGVELGEDVQLLER